MRQEPVGVSPEAHVQRYAAMVGERFELVSVLPGGRALEIADDGGTRFVLKWDDDEGSKARRRAAIGIAEQLGDEAGWPVPVFDLAENDAWLYVRQSMMRGAAPTELSKRLWVQVLDLVDSTAGLGSAAPSDWPTRLIDTLVPEPSLPTVYCSHEPLRQHSAAGRRLIESIEAVGTRSGGADLGGSDDLMHWDLHPGNFLVLDGDISAVIDLDNAGAGPRGFDLITFAISARVLPAVDDVGTTLLDEAMERASDELGIAAVAHLILRFSNWAIRTGHTREAEYWVDEGGRLLS